MIQVYGIKNCNKIRDTLQWLKEKEVEYIFFDLKKEPLTREELDEFVYRIGLDVLVNRRGTTWRNLGLSESELPDDELTNLLFENQSMIKRPVLVRDEAMIVGYDEDAFEEFISD
ncbi:MAG: Spx/MgsR family RNA polymerase-binding regulatory protein [Balneolaceae bacterium]|nr:MAG: Spx/MgsR family RNA polymerase-binding regulatory protein [Balneolaceae bacterium]